jgi:hypothetical protein
VTDPTNLNALADRLEAGDPLADVLADWGAYASDYFKDKWGLSDDVARLRQMDEDRSAAARILRAVAAAPGPLREWARRVRYLETENADLRARLHDTRVALAETHAVCREQAAEIARLQAVERSAFIADL